MTIRHAEDVLLPNGVVGVRCGPRHTSSPPKPDKSATAPKPAKAAKTGQSAKAGKTAKSGKPAKPATAIQLGKPASSGPATGGPTSEPAEALGFTSARQLAFDLGFCVVTTDSKLTCGDGCRKIDPSKLEHVDAVVGRCVRTRSPSARPMLARSPGAESSAGAVMTTISSASSRLHGDSRGETGHARRQVSFAEPCGDG